jgi:hypothetical protein
MKKFEIVETPDYILAVSNERNVGDIVFNKTSGFIYKLEEHPLNYEFKIIGYRPKGDASELDLPLLPRMAIEDDVEKLAKKYVDDNYPHYTNLKEKAAAIEDVIWGYKAATKVYNEDLHKLLSDFYVFATEGEVCNHITINDFIQSLKQPKTPKWFVAETKQKFQPDKNKRTDVKNGVYYELKTETNSEGKQVLKGHYL